MGPLMSRLPFLRTVTDVGPGSIHDPNTPGSSSPEQRARIEEVLDEHAPEQPALFDDDMDQA